MKRALTILALGACIASMAHAEQPLPLFDAHMHYNAEARSAISPEQVIAL
jgi:hypothetical protein